MSAFNDILQRAENLNAKNSLNGAITATPQTLGGNELDLRSIFRASEEIWKRKQLRPDSQWAPHEAIAKSTGRAEDIAAASTASSLPSTHEPIAAREPLDQTTATAFEDYLKRAQNRAKIEAERAFINQHILEHTRLDSSRGASLSARPKGGVSSTSSKNGSAMFSETYTNDALDYSSNVMAEHISRQINSNSKMPIKEAMEMALEEINEPEAWNIWRKVFPICSTTKPSNAVDVSSYRSAEEWQRHVLEQSTTLLQQIYKNHMETVVKNNLDVAQRGGVPGTLPLVEAYLNVRKRDRFYQDGYYGKHPIWPVLYHCLRIGDFNAAATVAKNLQNLPQCSVLAPILSGLRTRVSVDADKRLRLSAEWKHEMASCRDVYKRAVYAFILGNECDEVNDTIENWLWSRLMSCKLDPVNGTSHFHKLQSTICVDLGEDYFTSGTGNVIIYFAVLWLTGQIERAIDALFNADLKQHAVHIAILAYQQKLLVISERISAPILSYDPKDPLLCHLNFARLLLLYVKQFELTNLDFALCYCFYLRHIDFESEGSLDGSNVFQACVSRLCHISDDAQRILGYVNERGDRVAGIIDKFAGEVNVSDIIARVANDSDVNGETLVAARLYILANRMNEAARLISKQISFYIANGEHEPDEARRNAQKTLDLARWLEKHCKSRPDTKIDESSLAELASLVKLHQFYSTASHDPHEAISIMSELNVVPLSNDELPGRVASFVLLPDHVKNVLPDVIVTLMEAFVPLYNNPSMSAQKKQFFQNCSNVVLLYVAQINLRMPVHVNSKLLQLQSQIG